MDNIARLDQTQPISGRPVDPDWRTDSDRPMVTTDRFILQSGRRRLEACRVLGRSCAGLHDQISVEVDSANTPNRAFCEITPRLHGGTVKKPKTKAPEISRAENGTAKATAKPVCAGLVSAMIEPGKDVNADWLAKSLVKLIADKTKK